MPRRVSFPNQKVFRIHKEKPAGAFLMISKDNFYNAYQDLDYAGTILYLYIASNCDGYELSFSPQAVHDTLGMPESTCRDQVKKLIEKGYLIQKSDNSNIFDFYEIPQTPKPVIFDKDKNENAIWFE